MRRLSVAACTAVWWTVAAFAAEADTQSGSALSTDRVLDRVFAREPGTYTNFAPRFTYLSPWTFGVSFGVQVPGDMPVSSSQGFYTDGNLQGTAAGGLVGVSGFYDLWTTGSGSTLFSRHTHSVGLVVDAFLGASNSMHGLCGGFPCHGGFKLNQVNAIFEWKWTTSVAERTTFNFYVGAGPSFAWASGQPTGGGPRAQGDDVALAFRIGGGFSQQVAEGVTFDIKTGYQWTDELEFPTNLAGENFRVDVSGVYYTAVGFTFRPPVGAIAR